MFSASFSAFIFLLHYGHFPALSLLYCLQHALSEPLFADAHFCWIVSASHHWNIHQLIGVVVTPLE